MWRGLLTAPRLRLLIACRSMLRNLSLAEPPEGLRKQQLRHLSGLRSFCRGHFQFVVLILTTSGFGNCCMGANIGKTRTEGFHSLGVLQSLKKLMKHEGVIGFYKGNGASVLRIVPYAALHFMTYEQYRCWILNNYERLGTGPLIDLLAGSAAGGTAVLCTYPLDLARTKLAYQLKGTGGSFGNGVKRFHNQPAYHGIKDVFKSVYMEGGVRALYRGIGPTLIGILPYAGLKFYIYEELKTHVPEEHRKSIVLSLSCGALAGLFGQTFTYPLDVVRRQMQVQSRSPFPQGDPNRVRGTIQGLTTIVRNQGWGQLFAGLSINYAKIVPSVAIGFTAYDMMKSWLRVPPRENARTASP